MVRDPEMVSVQFLVRLHRRDGACECLWWCAFYNKTSYNQSASRPEVGALRAPVCAVIIRALRALITGRRATRACAASRQQNFNMFVDDIRIDVVAIPSRRPCTDIFIIFRNKNISISTG